MLTAEQLENLPMAAKQALEQVDDVSFIFTHMLSSQGLMDPFSSSTFLRRRLRIGKSIRSSVAISCPRAST